MRDERQLLVEKPLRLLLCIHFFAFLFLVASRVAAAVPEPVYRLVAEPYPPYEYEEAGRARGMNVEILERLAQQAGIRFEIIFQPWKRALQSVRGGEVDAVFSILRNREREGFLVYPETPLFIGRTVIFASAAFAGDMHSSADLAGHRVGVVSGHSYGPLIDQQQNFGRDPSVNVEACVRKMMHGRYALLLATRETGWHAIRKLQAANIRELSPVLYEAPYFIAVSRDSARGSALVALLSLHLQRMEKTGELAQIRKKYGSMPSG